MEEEFFIKNVYYLIIDGKIHCKSNLIETRVVMLSHGYEYNYVFIEDNYCSDIEFIWKDVLLK